MASSIVSPPLRRAFVLSLAVLALSASQAVAETLTWGSKGTGPGQFLSPSDVAIGPDGSVFVSDYAEGNARVQRFSASGQFLAELDPASTDPSRFFHLAAAPDGRVFVADDPLWVGGDLVRPFSPAGVAEPPWSTAQSGALAIGPAGDVFTIAGWEVKRYEPDGDLVTSWGGYGSTPGKVIQAVDLAVSSAGVIYVLDSGSVGELSSPPRVLAFAANGTLLDEWVLSVPGRSVYPSRIAIGPGGDLYVYDSWGPGILRFTPGGQFVAQLELEHDMTDMGGVQFGGLAAGPRYLYIAYTGRQRIVRIDTLAPEPRLAAAAQALTGSEVRFDAGASTTTLGRIAGYQWDLDGDGSFELDSGVNPVATRSYATRGTVNVSVKVINDFGGSSVVTQPLKVLPAPPPGPVGVSIENGAQYVNDPNVEVTIRWPRFAFDLLISNDGGFFPFSQSQVEETIKWKLRASGPERLPKTIYVRFQGGESGPETYQDDVILDQTDPTLKSALLEHTEGPEERAARAGRGSAILTIVASDRTSGVRKMQVSARKAKPGKWKPFRGRVKVGGGKLFVRVRDGAGNASRWRSAVPKG